MTGTEVKLDGNASYNPGGGMLRFDWTTAGAPAGSTAALNDPGRPDPIFIPDVEGDYVFALTVDNGQATSVPDQVTVFATRIDAPPNADAGRDQEVPYGATVTLDGTGSDDPNGLLLTYSWSFTGLPETSALTNADITDSNSTEAGLLPDVLGTYSLDLRVDNGSRSNTDGVSISVLTTNVPPVADAGTDRAVKPGEEVTLDGSLSRDPDSGPAPITYRWNLVARPSASNAADADIANADQPIARFTPDVEDNYIARIDVDDGQYQDGDNTSVFADGTPLTISITSPAEGATVETTKPTITVTFSDEGTGIDRGSFQLLLNGADATGTTRISDGSARYTPLVDLPGGDNTVTARVADHTGNPGEDTNTFCISVFRAIADCGPTTGTVPHTVTYRSRGQFTGGSIVGYRWGIDGDGTYDYSSDANGTTAHTYGTVGEFAARCRVTDAARLTGVSGEINTKVRPARRGRHPLRRPHRPPMV